MSLSKPVRVVLVLVLMALGVGAWWWLGPGAGPSGGTLRIAVVSKGLGPDSDSGIQRGATLYAERLNKAGGVNGRRVVLDIYDDEGKKDLGAERAREITQSEAIAAIGHRFSSVSASVGPIYQKAGMPIVSAASTSPNVTAGNDWYFRTVFNNNEQGRFLAGYIREVLKQRKVHVVHGTHGYGKTMARVFQETAAAIGLDVADVWQVEKRDLEVAAAMAPQVVADLKADPEPGLLFLIAYPEEAVPVIRAVREAGIDVIMMGTNSLARRDLPGFFAELPQERAQPGFYTDGVLVATPLIYDTANQFTGEFRRRYADRFGDQPDWRAAFAYDAMKVITEAAGSTASEPEAPLKARRQAVRDWIAALDGPDRAVPGVTGSNWFDENGDPRKPVSVAVFSQGVMVSAPFQLSDVRPGDSSGDQVFVDGRKMRRTDIVYTGADINRVDEIDLEAMTARIRGEIWFRHQGRVSAAEIEFINAAEDVELGEPIAEHRAQGMRYSRYPFEGKFLIDQLPGKDVYGEHRVGIAFRHAELDRFGIVYVNDLIGMGLSGGGSVATRLDKAHALAQAAGWRLKDANIASEVIGVSAQGNPDYTSAPGGELDFSTFNLVIRIAPDTLSIRRGLDLPWSIGATAMGLILILLASSLWRQKDNLRRQQGIWWTQVLGASALLVGLEALLLTTLSADLGVRWVGMMVQGFDMLWWLVPAFLITTALERFVWLPVEVKSDRPVPKLLRAFVNFLIYLFALFGIIAFVFDEKVTSLLASSGVIAMIIGLAVQMNISHLFSGIAINLERPFRVGDWVKIGSHEDGKVVSMNWRATRLVTRNMEVINLPNTKAAESTIKNYALPTEVTRLMHKVRVHPDHDTREVAAVLSKACLAVDGVLEDPAPIIFYLGVTEWASEFDVAFFIGDYQFQPKLKTDVWHSIWKHLNAAGFKPEIQRQNIRLLDDGGATRD